MQFKLFVCLICGLILILSCKTDIEILTEPPGESFLQKPDHFPEMPFPEGNEFTNERWEFGKMLFFDKRLSINNTISCATCHKQEFALADNTNFSDGVFGRAGTSNVPSLANIGYNPYFLRGGSVPTLEQQILVPIQEHNEFNHDIVLLCNELKLDTTYSKLAAENYDRIFDPFVLTRAISAYQRTFISGNSPYDQHEFGQENVLNASQLRGKELFFNDQNECGSCHSGFNFTNYNFENNGLYLTYDNPGRGSQTFNAIDSATFKVPSLRNIDLTAPYMHDGSIATLEDVVEHYNLGGVAHPNKSSMVKPLGLNSQEKEDLVNFLKSLTDYEFVNDVRFREE